MTDPRPTRSATRAELREVAGSRRYRQVLAVRLASQVGDGVVQLGLVSLVLLDPAQEASAPLVAGALSVGVLPFTLVGPFAGVLLDRWPRQRILVLANAARVVLVLCAAAVAGTTGAAETGLASWQLASLWVLSLTALSVNRFLLAGLGAALPHTVEPRLLVTANAVTPTLGTGAYAVGGVLAAGGLALLAPALGDPGGGFGAANAVVLVAGAGLYLVGAAFATRLPRASLGPDEPSAASTGEAARAAVAGLAEGARHVWERGGPRDALGAVGAHRFAFGLLTISLVLMARGHLADQDGAGLGVLVLAGGGTAVGALLAAGLTPPATRLLDGLDPARRAGLGPLDTWIVLALMLAAVTTALLAGGLTTATLTAGSVVLGLAGQSIKIAADTQVQLGVGESLRGRAFAFYDVVFNASFVVAVVVGAVIVPEDGYSATLYGGIALSYGLPALVHAARARRRATGEPPPTAS